VVAGDVVWPREIPPGWELEWVDDDVGGVSENPDKFPEHGREKEQ
jgi:hypothetical protein